MPTSRREVQVYLCDGCGQEFFSEMGESVNGMFISVLSVTDESNTTAEVYVCSPKCLVDGVNTALLRETLSEDMRIDMLYQLWRSGKGLPLGEDDIDPKELPPIEVKGSVESKRQAMKAVTGAPRPN